MNPAAATTAPLVRTSVVDGVSVVVIDSPANRNALSPRLMDELAAAIEAARSSRVLVLTHTGRVFCAGRDLSERRDPQRQSPDLLAALEGLDIPTVAVLRGSTRAGGLGLVAACDIVVADERSDFAFSEVRIGVVPAVIALPVLGKVSVADARPWLLTRATFDARVAASLGLVTVAVPGEDTWSCASRTVNDLLRGEPGAQATIKRMLRDLRMVPDAQQPQYVRTLSAEAFASDAARAGMSAFRERRDPPWVATSPWVFDATSL